MIYLPDRADELPCVADVSRRLAVREVTGEYVPSAFDVLIEQQSGPLHDAAAHAAREMCGRCPVMQLCLTVENRDEQWARAVLGTPRLAPRKRNVCGTTAGYSRHQYYREYACQACLSAVAQAKRERLSAAAACGTESGYSKHRRNKEEPCTGCKKARAAGERRRKKKRKARGKREAANLRRTEKLRDLIAIGSNLDEACAQLGLTAKGLENWCYRHDHVDLWRALKPPTFEALVKVRRRGAA